MTYDRILVTLDASEVAETVLAYALPLAERFASELRIVTIMDRTALIRHEGGATLQSDLIDPTLALRQAHDELASYLGSLQSRLRSSAVDLETQLVSGSPGPAIVEQARCFGADLIALAAHRRRSLRRWLAGDVSRYVIQVAPCPVLVVPVP